MKKKTCLVCFLSVAAMLIGCSKTSTSSESTEKESVSQHTETSNQQGSSSKNNVTKCGHHSFSFLNHKGLIDLEKCDECGAKAYKFPIKYAEGYKDSSTKMGRTGDTAKSTWNIEGQLATGKYEVEISAKLSQASSTDRHWYNHAKRGEETATSNPDTTSESDYRYWVSADSKATYPTSEKTWGEEGFDANNFNKTIFIDEFEASSTTKNIVFNHGDIGYSLYIDQIRLIAKEGTNVPDTLPKAPDGVFDPEGNTGGDTGGDSGTGEHVDVSDVPDIGRTPGGEGEGTYGKPVDKKVEIASSSVEAISLTSNFNGDEVSVLHEGIQQYVDAMYAAEAKENLSDTKKYQMRDNACGSVDPASYQGQYYENGTATQNKKGHIDYFGDSDRDNFKNVKLTWETDKTDAEKFYVEVGMKSDLSDAKVVEVDHKQVELSNLFVSKTYYWRVSEINGKYHSKVGSFKTKGSFRDINAGAAYNVRDIGGKMTSSGKRIKQGLIYRGGELTPTKYSTGITQEHIITLDKTGKQIFHDDLNIRVELDFRNSGSESNNQSKSYLGSDVKYQREACSSLAKFYNGDASMLKRIFTAFANAKPDAAVYCHCWGGADRTGSAFFLLEGLLGVSYTEALMDYEFTSFDAIHTRKRNKTVTDYNGYSYNFPDLTNAIKSSSYYSSTKSFSEIVEAWMKGKVKMSDTEIQNLKNNLLED